MARLGKGGGVESSGKVSKGLEGEVFNRDVCTNVIHMCLYE